MREKIAHQTFRRAAQRAVLIGSGSLLNTVLAAKGLVCPCFLAPNAVVLTWGAHGYWGGSSLERNSSDGWGERPWEGEVLLKPQCGSRLLKNPE